MNNKNVKFKENYLELDSKTKMWYATYGNPKGFPILVVHGGPGGGSHTALTKFVDVKFFKYIFFDQRGCGKSTPHLELKNNNTQQLVEDIEALRKHLKLDKLTIFGGSWGTTLALMYAIKYPQNVAKMILRGVFLARQEDVDFLYEGKGANWFFPKEYEAFKNAVAHLKGRTNIAKYYKALTNKKLDLEYRKKLAAIFYKWEFSLVSVREREFKKEYEREAYDLALLESHYFYNKSFMPSDNYILENADKFKHIPTYIIHGHFDIDTRLIGAYLLEQKLDNVKTYYNHMAGHSLLDSANLQALEDILEQLKNKAS